MKQFEIKSHDGPGRYGKLGDLETPAIINKNDFSIADDESSAYDVEKEIAQWSVNQTIEKAKLVEDKEIAVIQGSKYIDLRIKCLKELEELGYNGFIIANADDLLLHPRDLVDLIVALRQNMKPSSYLIFPFAEAQFIPLLAYMGVDAFMFCLSVTIKSTKSLGWRSKSSAFAIMNPLYPSSSSSFRHLILKSMYLLP